MTIFLLDLLSNLYCNFSIVMQVVYIAPLKAIVRERMNDWKNCLVSRLGKKMVHLGSLIFFLFFFLVSCCVSVGGTSLILKFLNDFGFRLK